MTVVPDRNIVCTEMDPELEVYMGSFNDLKLIIINQIFIDI